MAKESPAQNTASSPSRGREYSRIVLDRVRPALAVVRRWIDVALHDRRKERAIERLRRIPAMRRVVFLCYGNICRSPFAAAAYQRHLPPSADAFISSAGFVGPDRHSPEQALSAAAARGIDLSEHRSCLVSHSLVRDADLLVVMSSDQAHRLRQVYGRTRGVVVVLGDLDPEPIRGRTIIDPWGSDDAAFGESYDRILRCVRELARLTSSMIQVRSRLEEATS
jgi:protein-tyrosine phosphatase